MTGKLEKKLPDATFFIRDLDEATNVRDRLETLFTIREDLGESTNIEGLIEELQFIHDCFADNLSVRSDVFIAVRKVIADALDKHITKNTDALMYMGINAFDYRNRLTSLTRDPWANN
jgi:hypothetical protein